MLKFKNRETKTGKEFIYQISMSSVQGGVQVEVDEILEGSERKCLRSRTVLLTPMDAAAFVYDTRVTKGLHCRDVGHCVSLEGSGNTLWIGEVEKGSSVSKEFVSGLTEVCLYVAGIAMFVPTFVIDAMRLAIEQMMVSLFFMSTGEMEEEFG